MPENPQTPPPYQPIKPWVREMVTDKPVVKPVVAPVEENKVVPPVVEEKKPEVTAPATPVVTEAPALVAPATPAPVATAPVSTTPPASPLK